MATFSVLDQLRRTQGTGDGSNTEFSFSFQVNNTSDIKVHVGTTLQTESTHYDIVDSSNAAGLNADGTGKVKFKTSPTDYTPANGATVTIHSDVPLARTSVYNSGGNITATALESDFDTITMQVADREERDARALTAPITDPVTVDMSIPAKSARLGYVLGFDDSTGNPILGPKISNFSTLTSISADIATLADIEDGTVATTAISRLAAVDTDIDALAAIKQEIIDCAAGLIHTTPISRGGTGATTAAQAKINLGITDGITLQEASDEALALAIALG